MAYLNLKSEMGKADITIESVADALDIHRNSAANKIKGKSSFSIEESMIIQKKFFPALELNYLFAKSDDQNIVW